MFTESQIVAILKEGEAGVSISELTRKHGISRLLSAGVAGFRFFTHRPGIIG
jgi:hypothetical protein